jgi:hypothetical protein
MAARSESQYRWQCCGCKAIYLSEKNVKIHVAHHAKAEAAAPRPVAALAVPAAAAARAAAAAAAAGPPAGTRRLQAGRPSCGVRALRPPPGRQTPSRGPSHWQDDTAAATVGQGAAAGPGRTGPGRYQMILLNQAGRTGGPGARIIGTNSTRAAAAAHDSARAESESESESESEAVRAGPGAGELDAPTRRRRTGADRASARGGDHDEEDLDSDWQDDAEHDVPEPGKLCKYREHKTAYCNVS